MINEQALEPLLLVRELDHVFKGKTVPYGKSSRRVCEKCGYVRNNVIHHAFPQSTRIFGSGSRMAYQGANDAWKRVFKKMLNESDLPRGLASVRVEGICTFGKRTGGRKGRVPDQENFRYLLSKFFADTLVDEGYIEDDSWFCFSFGDLGYRYQAGVWQLDLMVMPSYAPLAGYEILEGHGDVGQLPQTVDA